MTGEDPMVANQWQIAEIFEVSRVTISNWQRAGLPVRSREGAAGENSYDVARAVAWVRARDRAQAEQAIATARAERRPDAIRARRWTAEAKLKELDVARREGSMVPVAAVDLRWSKIAVQVRTELLGLATRLKARCPEATTAVVMAVDGLIRECLESLADGGAGK